MPTVRVTGHDASAEVRAPAEQIRFCDDVTDTPGAAVMDADLVILCVPVGVMGPVAAEIAADLPADAIISDVGSCKAGILARSEEHTSELQSLMRISYAVFSLKNKNKVTNEASNTTY